MKPNFAFKLICSYRLIFWAHPVQSGSEFVNVVSTVNHGVEYRFRSVFRQNPIRPLQSQSNTVGTRTTDSNANQINLLRKRGRKKRERRKMMR